jgi:uncharacterized protein YcaQ
LKDELSPSAARRIALTAQGFNGLNRAADVGEAALPNAIRRLGLLQIDSVGVIQRYGIPKGGRANPGASGSSPG